IPSLPANATPAGITCPLDTTVTTSAVNPEIQPMSEYCRKALPSRGEPCKDHKPEVLPAMSIWLADFRKLAVPPLLSPMLSSAAPCQVLSSLKSLNLTPLGCRI